MGPQFLPLQSTGEGDFGPGTSGPGLRRKTTGARARMWRGRLSAAGDACDAVLAARPRPGYEPEHLECLGYLALIAAWRGENRRAGTPAPGADTTPFHVRGPGAVSGK